ncbi:Cholera toxin secretion protein epsF [Serratia quinivorans]|uniref:type II secretion system inner membrane protein GspF n=1 Tax=Serratia quinivorans TaxID=137545 RepID=UPI0021786767|nr:type II secretion system inner membrane protein GspF [Serratia quinivorans]CAI1926807.1 Cholera toxin secretion protein epsF [Serratia quinivorans]
MTVHFRYQALDAQGRKQRGRIQAPSLRIARQQLREQQLTVVGIEPDSEPSLLQTKWFASPNGHIQGNGLVLLTRQLATLVSAALPLEEALYTLAKQSEKNTHRTLLQQIRTKILEGQSLAEALALYPKTFNTLFRAMVAAGEASGHLGQVLTRLADYIEQTQQLKNKLLQAMIYPIVLTLVAIGVISILLTAVVPKVVEQFVHMKQALPLTTQILIAISHLMRSYGLWALLALSVVLMSLRGWLRSPTNKLSWHRWQLRLPILGNVIRELNLARYARTLSILSASAIPLLEAMRISAAVLTNLFIRQQLQTATEQVREGRSLAQSLEHTRLMSPMMQHMVASGENSGELVDMLARTADIQEHAFANQTTITLALFEPLLVVSMASVVLFIILAILQPILQLNSLIG